jgi:hypothetical protein
MMIRLIAFFIALIGYASIGDCHGEEAISGEHHDITATKSEIATLKNVIKKMEDTIKPEAIKPKVAVAQSQGDSDKVKQLTDPNFKDVNEIRDRVREYVMENSTVLKEHFAPNDAIAVLDNIEMVTVHNADTDDIRHEISKLEEAIQKADAPARSLTVISRICYLAVVGERSLFSTVEGMNHRGSVSHAKIFEVFWEALHWAGVFDDEKTENVVNTIISAVSRASLEEGKNVPSLLLINSMKYIRKKIIEERINLELVIREINRRLKQLIGLLESHAEDLASQAKSPNTPDVVKPLIETNKNVLLKQLAKTRNFAKELIEKLKSMHHTSGKIAEILGKAAEIKVDGTVLCE